MGGHYGGDRGLRVKTLTLRRWHDGVDITTVELQHEVCACHSGGDIAVNDCCKPSQGGEELG